MPDIFVDHGLHRLHEWPELQDAALTLLEARRKAHEKSEAVAGEVNAPPQSEESLENGDSSL